ncbi:acyltransferase [Streptomyces olivaceiscleroticus]|uniref:Transferase n=1 Tax=Streptomyces olivaceiscleroticus TaxID=68245 RepID=A0ABN1B103_9ACTN
MSAVRDRCLPGAPPPAAAEPLIETAVEITANAAVGTGSWIRHGSAIGDSTIEQGVFVGFRARIHGATVATGCQIASLTRIGRPGGAAVRIGRAAWIGARAVVEPGVHIGAGAVVGAGAHVTADVPDDALVIGRPARVLRRREVTEDGLPDFGRIIAAVRARHDSNSRPLPKGWRADGPCVLDADLSGGVDVVLGTAVIAMGRADGPSPAGGIRAASGVRIGDRAVLEASSGIDIGADATIGARALVVSSGHDLSRRSLPWRSGPVRIGAGVRVGDGATVVGPASLGDGAVVAPGAVVIGDVPAGHTTSGVFERNPS